MARTPASANGRRASSQDIPTIPSWAIVLFNVVVALAVAEAAGILAIVGGKDAVAVVWAAGGVFGGTLGLLLGITYFIQSTDAR
jgi:hypothetical protein